MTPRDPADTDADRAARRVEEITRRLSREYEITVTSPRSRAARHGTVDGVRHVHGGLPWGGRLRTLTWRVGLPLTVLRRRPDLVVESCAGPLPVALVPWPLRRPTVATLTDGPTGHRGHRGRAMRPHQHLVADSGELGAELGDLFPTTPVTVVPDGLAEAAFTPRHRSRRHVIYLGPLDRTHGVDLLVAAWATVAATSTAELILVGGGPDEDEMRARVARLGLVTQVRFAGRVLPSARFDILASAHVVVTAGSHANDALLAAEALAVASPVVAFHSPGLRAVVDADTGVLVARDDTSALAQAVLDLLDDPGRARALGEAGPARVAGRRWDAVAALEAAVYERAVRREPEPHPAVAPLGAAATTIPATTIPASTTAAPIPAAPLVTTPPSAPPGRAAVLVHSLAVHPRRAVLAAACLIAVGILAASNVITMPHSGRSTLADSQHAAGTSTVALANNATVTRPGASIPVSDPRSSARTAQERRRVARRAAAEAEARADLRRRTRRPRVGLVATPTTRATSPVDAPTTTTAALASPPTSTRSPTPSSPATSSPAPPTRTPTTSRVLTEHVTATLICTASATVTINGSGGGSNTLTATGVGVSRTMTGGAVAMTLTVGVGTYTAVDTSTAGDSSMHWGWAPSSACDG